MVRVEKGRNGWRMGERKNGGLVFCLTDDPNVDRYGRRTPADLITVERHAH